MTSTTFIPQQTVIASTWLNDVNKAVYGAIGNGTTSPTSPPQVIQNLGIEVLNIAALRLQNKARTVFANVLGYYAAQDGGGGFYYLDSADTTSADNGGSIIVAVDGGRWKLYDVTRLSVRQFGAKGDGVTDDTVAIQNCYNAVATGGTLYIPAAIGTGLCYRVSRQGANPWVLNFSRYVHIRAEGFYSALAPAAGTTVNIIYLQPSTLGFPGGLAWDGLSLGEVGSNVMHGLNGIFIDTQLAQSNLPNALFTRLNIRQGDGGGVGVLHINNAANNVNGGMYTTTFADSVIWNGFNLQASGDSNHIERNTISGNGIGVAAGIISGASELTILGNNITTNGGQILISSGSRFHILNNNMEQQVATTGSTVMVNISGSGGTITNGEIRGNHMGAFTGSNMTANLLIGANAQGTTVDGNTFLNANVGFIGPAINDGGISSRMGFNQYGTNLTTTITPGTGCMGFARSLTLVNGWVTFNAGKPPTVFKDMSGMVYVTGVIASGTVTANTTLFTLPDVNYAPSQVLKFAASSANGGTISHGEIQIDTAGVCTIQASGGGSTYLSLNAVFPAANAGVLSSNL